MKKKLLLVGVAAMGLLAVGVGATSTFAWYTANSIRFSASSATKGSVETVNTAAADNMPLLIGLTWSVSDKVNLSDAGDATKAGCTRVWNGTDANVASNDKDLIKAGLGKVALDLTTLTKDPTGDLTNIEKDMLKNKTFTITVNAVANDASKDLVRVGTSLSKVSDATGSEDVDGTSKKPVGGRFVGATKTVNVGTVTLDVDASHNVSVKSYSSTVTGPDTSGCYFYYSVTPETANNVEATLKAGDSYGALTATLAE